MNPKTIRPSEAESLDPRIRRSRRMLHDALSSLLKSKDFDKISIQDIAEASTLNRATFYDHYPDKFALLQCMVGSRFGELMAVRNVPVDNCQTALRAIALGVCDYLAEAPLNGGISHQGVLQTAVIAVVREMFQQGLSHRRLVAGLDGDVVASTVAWAIYGAADAWINTPNNVSAEHMADVIDRLVKPILVSAVEDDDAHHVPKVHASRTRQTKTR